MSSSELKLSIYTPERKLLENVSVLEVTLPTLEGEVQVLPEHAYFVGMLDTGIFHFQTSEGESHKGFLSTGYYRVDGNRLTVSAETLEWKDEIDLARAETAQKKSEENLKEGSGDFANFKKYELKLQRALVRQQLVKGLLG